jgi:hypothetical protein
MGPGIGELMAIIAAQAMALPGLCSRTISDGPGHL